VSQTSRSNVDAAASDASRTAALQTNQDTTVFTTRRLTPAFPSGIVRSELPRTKNSEPITFFEFILIESEPYDTDQ
jgi:hypothetical protein